MKLWTLILASALAFTSLHADAAKRLGGGKSVGQQSNNVTQNQAAKPAAPAQAAAHGVPCSVVWQPVWDWLGWPTPWVWVPNLVSF
jgi:hypothetical protein